MSKLHGNRIYKDHDPNPAVNGFDPVDPSSDKSVTYSIRIEVYKGNEYQGKKIFSHDRIIIGKSLEADLVLSDNEIADKHACITFIDEQLVILDQTQKSSLLIRGGLYGISIIDTTEQVGLGPYILKINHHKTSDDRKSAGHNTLDNSFNTDIRVSSSIDLSEKEENSQTDSLEHTEEVADQRIENEKPEVDLFSMLEGSSEEDNELYDLVFEGDIKSGLDINNVKVRLSKIFKSDESRIEHLFNTKRIVLKSALKIDDAKKYKKVFEKSGAVCQLAAHKGTAVNDLSVQEEISENYSAGTEERVPHEIGDRAQNETHKRITENDSNTIIKPENRIAGDNIVSHAHHSEIEVSAEPGIQAPVQVPVTKVEKIVSAVRKSQSSYDSLNRQFHDPDTCVSSDIQLHSSEQEEIPTREEIVSYVEESRPVIERKQSFSKQVKEKSVWKFYGVGIDDEEDEDDEDFPADFYLKDRINALNASSANSDTSHGGYLEVIKLSGSDVIDIQHLEEKDRFYISDDNNKRFCLAEYKRDNEALFSFNKNLIGNIEIEGRKPVATSSLMNDENRISKRKGIYRTGIPRRGRVMLSDGYFDYQMRIVGRSLVPEIPEVKGAKKKSYRHFGVSFAFHIVFITFLGLFPSFDNGNKVEEEPRFVQLDTTQLAELEKVMNPQKKPEPKPPEPAPVVEPKLKKEDKPTELKKEPVRVASNKKPAKSKTVAKPSSHPDAGGGFGEGNVAARNINETGILGIISDSVGIQPRNALAAVTNLDAVSSPNVTSGNLKVGGVVGHLGTGEIAVPKGTIVATKGSSQVLRSYGRKGEGTVAALEKGKIGEQEVMGMVTATLDKSARIRGGLSMEAVKRVIDEHLDDITYCYETELIANPSIVGKVMFEWKILMSGEVGEVRIKSSSINSHEIHACIKEAIRTWRFPKPSGSEVLVSYPFVFDIVGF